MAVRRRFSASFKGQVVEELLAGAATVAQLCRRYELCLGVIRNWKDQYAKGQLVRIIHEGLQPGVRGRSCSAWW